MRICSGFYISRGSLWIRKVFTFLALCVSLNSTIVEAAEEVGGAAERNNISLVKLNAGQSQNYFPCNIMGDYDVFKNNIKIATLQLGDHGNVHFPHELGPLGFLDGSWIDFNVTFEPPCEDLKGIMKDVTAAINPFIKLFFEKNHLMVNECGTQLLLHWSPACFQGFRGLIDTVAYNVPKVLAAKEVGWSVSPVLPTTGAPTGEAWIIQYPPLTEREKEYLTALERQLEVEEKDIIRRRRELLTHGM